MAIFDTVNIIGSTIYFVFVVLLIWLSRIPRTNPGAHYWVAAIFFSLCGRLSLLVFGNLFATQSEYLYAGCLVLEKYFLLLGALKFFNLPQFIQRLSRVTGIALGAILASWLINFNHLVFSLGLSLFNAAMLLWLAYIALHNTELAQEKRVKAIGAISLLLVLHWLTYPLLRLSSYWLVPGFLIGTGLVVLLYLTLISAVLMQFQKRLLDAEHHALDLAYHDPLTGLNNQRYMTTLFDQALLLAMRPHQMLAVIYIDLDNFKPINDTAGHFVGDEVLKAIAQRLRETTRSTDICARVGGDEFVIIVTQLENEEDARLIAEKILRQCCTSISVDQKTYQLGASLGVSIYPLHSTDLGSLLKMADKAMYEIKKNGKSGYQIYSEL